MILKGRLVAFNLEEHWIEIDPKRMEVKRVYFAGRNMVSGLQLGGEVIAQLTDDGEGLVSIKMEALG